MKSFQILRRSLSLPLSHTFIDKRANDQYLVSYPRSGSTWLRHMLVNVMIPSSMSDTKITNKYIPGVSLTRLPKIWRLNSPRIIHTHTYFRKSIFKAIYLIRDGRDVIISFYHYTTTRRGAKSISFRDWFFKYCNRTYGHRWDENVESWLIGGKQRIGKNLLIIRFEDMKSKPAETVRGVMDFLNLKGSNSLIESAVQSTRIDYLRKKEQERTKKIISKDAYFVRGGKIGQWKNYFDSETLNQFLELSNNSLEIAGYIE